MLVAWKKIPETTLEQSQKKCCPLDDRGWHWAGYSDLPNFLPLEVGELVNQCCPTPSWCLKKFVTESFKYTPKYNQQHNKHPCMHHPALITINILPILLHLFHFLSCFFPSCYFRAHPGYHIISPENSSARISKDIFPHLSLSTMPSSHLLKLSIIP